MHVSASRFSRVCLGAALVWPALAFQAQSSAATPPGAAAPASASKLSVSSEELATLLTQGRRAAVRLIDVRGLADYGWLRLPDAVCRPGALLTEGDLLDLRGKAAPAPKLVFYATDGGALAREAAEKAAQWGFVNVGWLEGGVVAWSAQQPERTLFGDQILAAVESAQRPGAASVDAASLAPAEFSALAKDGQHQLIDLRSPAERAPGQPQPKLGGAIPLSPEEAVAALRNRSVIRDSHLLFFDFDGGRLPAVDYYLKKFGVTDYRFARGGAAALVEAESNPPAASPPAEPAPTPTPVETPPPPAALPAVTPTPKPPVRKTASSRPRASPTPTRAGAPTPRPARSPERRSVPRFF